MSERETEYVCSSAGYAAALEISPDITDAEFRMLVLLSECPDGPGFSAELNYFSDRGMDSRDAIRAAQYLAGVCEFFTKYADTQFFLSKDHHVQWRFYE
jgi:hypothetical protein